MRKIATLTICIVYLGCFAQNSPCFPFPTIIKNIPTPLRERPDFIEVVMRQNNSEAFKKRQDIGISYQWFPAGMQICRGVTLSINAIPLMNYNGNKIVDQSVNLEGGACDGPAIVPNLNCNALIAKIGNGEPFLVGSKYLGKARTSGELFLLCNGPASLHAYFAFYCRLNISVTAEDPCKAGESPQVNDVIIYWKGGRIVHSGYVALAGGCKIYAINSFVQKREKATGKGAKIQSPEDDELTSEEGPYKYGDTWTIYHVDKSGDGPKKNDIKLIPADYPWDISISGRLNLNPN